MGMATFLMISRHTPDKCPFFNEAARKAYIDFYANKSFSKHGVKLLGAWSVSSEHQNYLLFEAPSVEAIQKAGMEPDFLAIWASETAEIKLAMGMEEAMKMLKQFASVTT